MEYYILIFKEGIYMQFIQSILRFLDTQWTKPEMYGAFHIASLVATVLVTVLLCLLWKKGKIKNVRKVVLVTAIIVGILEIYKQINFSFGYEGGISFDYQWYAFPWQFCSTPLYIGLLAGLVRGKSHDNLCAYLATYALFAGLGVMFYPSTVFTSTLGICIQTMVCHGSMIVIAVFLYYTGYVRAELKTLWKAIPVFVLMLGIAVTLNEVANLTGLLETETFNMFFVSPYCEPSLPVYSLVQNALMGYSWGYPVCLALYVFGFTVCALVMVAIPMGIKKFNETDFDARYAEQDRLRAEEAALRAEKKAAYEAQLQAKELAKAEEERLEKERKQAEKLQKREEKLKKKEAKKSAEKAEELREKAERKEKKEEKKKKRKEEKKEKRKKKKAEKKRKRKERKEKRKEERRKEREEKKRIKKEKDKAKKKALKEKRKAKRKLKRQQRREERKAKFKAWRERNSKEAREQRHRERVERERIEIEKRAAEKAKKEQKQKMKDKGVEDNPHVARYYQNILEILDKDFEVKEETVTVTPAEEFVAPVVESAGFRVAVDASGEFCTITHVGECKDLDIVIPTSIDGVPVRAIDRRAFEYCFNITSVVIPEGVERIGEFAFNYCGALKVVSLPESLEKIEDGLFSECTSLRRINYAGLKSQWRVLKKGEHWNERTPEYLVKCFNGDVDR